MKIRTIMTFKNEKGETLTVTDDFPVDGFLDQQKAEHGVRKYFQDQKKQGKRKHLPDNVADAHADWESDVIWGTLFDTKLELIDDNE